MKAYFKLLIVPLLIATACSPSYVGTSAYQDDIYYVPGEASLIDQEMAVYATHAEKKEPRIETKAVEPATKSTFKDERDFQRIQEEYNQMIQNDSIESIDTTFYNEDQGYYLSEFKGSEWDREDAESLRRWYPQGFGFYDNTGYNTAMWLAGDPDWNVYIEGDKVWWTPSWTNFNYYNAYRFSPVRYGRTFAYNYPYCGSSFGFGFGLGYGFYDDFYWSLNFGWGYPYYSPYSYYGGCYPYYGYNHHHHGGYYGSARYSNNYYGHRTSMGTKLGTNQTYTNRSAATRTNGTVSRINRSAGYTKSGTTTSRSATTAQESIRRSTAAQRYGSRNSRGSYSNRVGTSTRQMNPSGTVRRSNYQGTTTRYGTQNRSSYSGTKSATTTRRRTSNYTKPQSNSRPSYNNSGTKRSINTRGTSTRTSGYSKVRSTPSSNRSSTRSSSSSYSPSRSSSSHSSGAVRSSSSSSRSSNSGSRSGGGSRRR